MAVNSELVDWLTCCGCEREAPKFVNSGVDSINKLRSLGDDQFRKIGAGPWTLYENFRKLHDRTKTREELSQEASVSIIILTTFCDQPLIVYSGECARAWAGIPRPSHHVINRLGELNLKHARTFLFVFISNA